MIRLLREDDLEQVVRLLIAHGQDSVYGWIGHHPDPRYLTLWLLWNLSTKRDVVAFVADIDGELVGVCIGEIMRHPLLPNDPHTKEIALYVTPEYRDTRVSGKLWLAFLRWTKSRDIPYACRGKRAGRLTEIVHWVKVGKTPCLNTSV